MKFLNRLATGSAVVLLFLVSQTIGAAVELNVKKYRCFDSQGEARMEKVGDTESNVCQVGDRVIVEIPNLEGWIQADPKKRNLDNLVLALDGQLLAGNNARPIELGLSFELARKQQNTNNMSAWRTLLTRTDLLEAKEMTVSIALEDSIETYGEKKIWLRVASKFRMWIVAIFYLVLLAIFYWLVRYKGLLRDPGPLPEKGTKPFSLGASQMAFWFFIVIGGFLYVWLVVGDLAVLTPGVIGLIGISSVTGLVATSVASSKKPAIQAELLKLKQAISDLDTRLVELKEQIETVPPLPNLTSLVAEQEQKQSRRKEIESKIADVTRVPSSEGYFQDIVSSSGETSLPRFQMVGWTVALGIVFVHSVFTTLNMPEFDATLLSLMGISSGTYVGFKIPGTAGK